MKGKDTDTSKALHHDYYIYFRSYREREKEEDWILKLF